MISGLLGKKLRMSRMIAPAGDVVGATLLSLGPCYVTQLKTVESDGYEAAQIGYEETKKLNKPALGHLKATPRLRYLREVKVDDGAEVAGPDVRRLALRTGRSGRRDGCDQGSRLRRRCSSL